MAMSSYDYWKKREDLNRKNQVKDQKRREAWLRDTYEDMMKSCTDQIEAFYARYAHRNGITIAETRKRVAELDIKAYSRKARKYVKEKDFSETANEEMALYNLTMKVNRLEMLKAQMNLELTAGFDSVDKYFKGELRDAALDEYKRMAGILGKTVQNPTRRAESLVNASFKNATFSQRIWQHHNALINTLSIELTNALIQGKHPRDLAKIVASKFGVYRYAAERLMITEVARVQTGAQKEAYERNGYGEYVFITEAKPCPDCARLAGQQFKLKDMQPGENAPPMHPICRCSTAAAMDQDEFEKWLAGKEDARKMLTKSEAEELRDLYKGLRSSGSNGIIPNHKPPKFIRKLLDSEDRREVLLSYEKRIADSELENAVVITKDGEVYHCYGNLNGVYPDVDLGDKLIGADVTHNHPRESDNEYSFSSSDLRLFDSYRLHCLRGIDYLFEYELDRNAENIDSDQKNIFDADVYSYRHSMVIEEAHKYGFGYRRIHRR